MVKARIAETHIHIYYIYFDGLKRERVNFKARMLLVSSPPVIFRFRKISFYSCNDKKGKNIYIHMHIYLSLYIYIHIYIYIHTLSDTHIHTTKYIYIYTYISYTTFQNITNRAYIMVNNY